MSEVFISYRQTNDQQRQRVRAFAERLRDAEITVILDQFLLDVQAGGPNEGWDNWSSDRALNSEFVLIIGTQDWFECFNKKQKVGTGLGAACEADDLRHRIHEAGGVIETIRVVLFDEADAAYIPAKLKRYHRFHAEKDFANIVRWLGGTVPIATDDTLRTAIPHNLPSLQPFFGREEELKKIADAIDPESHTWGKVIDGFGGMGKTSLAVRAAYNVSPQDFEKIVFVSLKSRKLDEDGVRDLSVFLISGLAELLNELARELGHADIAKASPDHRPRMLLDALRVTRTLLVLDNLESLIKKDRDIVFTFVENLPPGCKAILTSRGRIGSGAEELTLEKLSEGAALATLAKVAENNPALARTSKADRLDLYSETGGKPLLLRWTAGQIGRGSCLTSSDAINYLRSCPDGNDPLEFIFGDLVENFSDTETHVLCALTYFTLPAKVEHIAGLAACAESDADRALRSMVNRSLVVPSDELKAFTLVPLVADFLRKQKPDVMKNTGERLEKHAYAVVIENGYEKYDRFPVLEAEWPLVAAALPQFLAGPNDQLHTVCTALFQSCNYSGRFDESLALNEDAERRAVLASDFSNAGWDAHRAGWIYGMRAQSAEVLACADRAEAHWRKAQAGTRELAFAIHLRGLGHQLSKDYKAASLAYGEAVELLRTLGSENMDVAMALNSLATTQRGSWKFDAAERNYRQALHIAKAVDNREGIGIYTGNLADLALYQSDWVGAESLARDALSVSETIGRQELTAFCCYLLSKALVRQGRKTEALPHAQRAVNIFTQIVSPRLNAAADILAECHS